MERFWNKVNKSSSKFGIDGKFSSECWEWTGCLSAGYGLIRINGKSVRAHRYSWEQVNGKILPGMIKGWHEQKRNCLAVLH